MRSPSAPETSPETEMPHGVAAPSGFDELADGVVDSSPTDAATPSDNALWRPPKTVQIGGQALVEGVMMRSPRFIAASVRRKDNSITTRLEPVTTLAQKHKWARAPFVRGVVGLFEMLTLGTKFLRWSADMALEDEQNDPDAKAVAHAKTAENAKMPAWMFFLTALVSMSFGILLFVALPHWIAGVTLGRALDTTGAGAGEGAANRVGFNVFEGAVKLAIFVFYVWFIGRGKNIRRVFEFHGAEHKVVYAVENNRPLTPDGSRDFDTPHPRCGTGFAMLTIMVSVLCFSFLPVPGAGFLPKLEGALYRIALMPVVAGLSYEFIKLTTHPRWQKLAVLLLTPGLWLQRLTTRQPDDQQLEVACAAMRAVLEAEGTHPIAKSG